MEELVTYATEGLDIYVNDKRLEDQIFSDPNTMWLSDHAWVKTALGSKAGSNIVPQSTMSNKSLWAKAHPVFERKNDNNDRDDGSNTSWESDVEGEDEDDKNNSHDCPSNLRIGSSIGHLARTQHHHYMPEFRNTWSRGFKTSSASAKDLKELPDMPWTPCSTIEVRDANSKVVATLPMLYVQARVTAEPKYVDVLTCVKQSGIHDQFNAWNSGKDDPDHFECTVDPLTLFTEGVANTKTVEFVTTRNANRPDIAICNFDFPKRSFVPTATLETMVEEWKYKHLDILSFILNPSVELRIPISSVAEEIASGKA